MVYLGGRIYPEWGKVDPDRVGYTHGGRYSGVYLPKSAGHCAVGTHPTRMLSFENVSMRGPT